MLKNYKIQTESGKCGLYDLANVLRNDDLFKYENDSEFVPMGYFQMRKLMEIEKYKYLPVPIVFMPKWYHQIPVDFFVNLIEKYREALSEYENKFMIFNLNVQFGDNEFTMHSISIVIDKNKTFYTDPHNEGFLKLPSLYDIYDLYEYVNMIISFANNSEIDGYETGLALFEIIDSDYEQLFNK